jgi:hypothetical protein
VSAPVTEWQWQYKFKIIARESMLYVHTQVFKKGTGGKNKAKHFE